MRGQSAFPSASAPTLRTLRPGAEPPAHLPRATVVMATGEARPAIGPLPATPLRHRFPVTEATEMCCLPPSSFSREDCVGEGPSSSLTNETSFLQNGGYSLTVIEGERDQEGINCSGCGWAVAEVTSGADRKWEAGCSETMGRGGGGKRMHRVPGRRDKPGVVGQILPYFHTLSYSRGLGSLGGLPSNNDATTMCLVDKHFIDIIPLNPPNTPVMCSPESHQLYRNPICPC